MQTPALFDTERLCVRSGRLADAPSLFARYTGRADASRFLQRTAHASVTDTARFIQTWSIDSFATPSRRFAWLIEERASGDVIGVVVVTMVRDRVAELHFGLSPDRWGRGYATEACTPVADWLNEQAGVRCIESYCDEENVASMRVLEKLGFRPSKGETRSAVLPALGPEPRTMQVFARDSA